MSASDQHDRDRNDTGSGDVRAAAERLEHAVEDLVRTAGGAVSGSATRLIGDLEQSARRLRDQVAREAGPAPRSPRIGGGPDLRPTRSNGWLRNLYRDRDRAWLGGICAGLARYFGTEPWVMRIVALSGLVFVPQIIIFGYIVGMFMLAPLDRHVGSGRSSTRVAAGPAAPEFGPYLSPRPALRAMRVEFTDIEERLRRMEGYVTSRQFTLRRELDGLEPGPGPTASR